MEIKLTPLMKDDTVEIFADIYPDSDKSKFGLSAKPADFIKRPLFIQNTGDFAAVLTVSVEEARRFAYRVLKDTRRG